DPVKHVDRRRELQTIGKQRAEDRQARGRERQLELRRRVQLPLGNEWQAMPGEVLWRRPIRWPRRVRIALEASVGEGAGDSEDERPERGLPAAVELEPAASRRRSI